MTAPHLSDIAFDTLPLTEPLQRALAKAGFTHCTPIQAKTLPLALDGQDIAGQAQTGTGKTAAFLLATMNKLLTEVDRSPVKPHFPHAVIVAPTRELAVQIHKEAEMLGEYTGLKFGLAYGGFNMHSQHQLLADGIDVLVGTPGRIIDCLKQRWLHLGQVRAVVLDEADRMFDLGFISQLRFILRRLPSRDKRQGLMFSATLSSRVMELAYEHLDNPTAVSTTPEQRVADKIDERVYYASNEEKLPLLMGLLARYTPARAIVFVNTRRAAEAIGAALSGQGVAAGVLSGDVPQKRRLTLLGRFQEGSLPVLVATDVAARGLHIPDVSHVFNFDLPQDAEEYVHRIGRTGRIGSSGTAISFACEEYAYSLPEIEAYIGHKIPSEPIPADLPAARSGSGRSSGVAGASRGQERRGSATPGQRKRPARRRSGKPRPA
jgi:ATP-dependent RNA helicase RhlB